MKRISPWHTVRGRLIFLAIGIEVVMLTMLVGNSLRLLHGSMSDQVRWQAEQTVSVLNAALTAPLAQLDLATVQAVLDESRVTSGLDYIVVVDRSDRRVAASGWHSETPLPEPSGSFALFDTNKEPRYNVAVPVTLHGQRLGTLHIGLNLAQIVKARRSLLTQGVTIAAFELLLSSIILLFVGAWLTRHLTGLTETSLQVASGNFTPSPVYEGEDDIGQLGVAFNTMSRVIADRVHELQALNETLEARVAEEVNKNRQKDSILLHQDKLASIGQLAAGVAHEINNPMGFIMSNLRTLKNYADVEQQYLSALEETIKECCPDAEHKQLEELRQRLDLFFILEDIPPLIAESLEGAERVKRIVLDLKDFARTDEDSLKETDLNQCVQSTANIVRNEIRYVADLDLQLGDIPLIVCNPQQINQVIANLLVNAAHAIDGHGRITVTTSADAERVLLTVADTGCGIPLDIRTRIFDPFFTTKDVGKGTGLGLSISYDIIRKHGGEITLESESGSGTTFMISLPISGPGGDSPLTLPLV
ncbi:MAG: HAMP domain-containing protein [Deltaproteobacteria bacterium]|nr:HAMP domain-containing protein [Deltaproteobacteria bacterium]